MVKNSESKIKIIKILSWSYIYGSGFCAFLFFYFGLMGIKASILWIWLIFFVSVLFFILSKAYKDFYSLAEVNNKDFVFVLPSLPSPLLIVAIFALIVALLLIISNLLFMPLWDIDSFALWGLKSKVVFYDTLDKKAYFHRISYGFSHLEYPLLVPLLNAGVYICAGETLQSISKLLYVPLLLSFGMAIFYSTTEEIGPKLGLALLSLYFSLPAFIQWSSAGTAEIYVVVFYFSALYFSLQVILKGTMSYALPAIFANIFLVFTKNEGLPIAFFNLLLLAGNLYFLRKSQIDWLKFFSFLVFAFLFLVPWFLWSHDIPRIHENYPKRIWCIFDYDCLLRIPQIFKLFFSASINVYRWGIFWFLLFVGLVIVYRNRESCLILQILLANLMLYIFIFVISPWDLEYLAKAALERLFLHLSVPSYYVLIFFLKNFVLQPK